MSTTLAPSPGISVDVAPRRTWRSFGERLTDELAAIEDRFVSLLGRSTILNVDPNRRHSDVWFVGAAEWGWRPDESLIPERTSLLDVYSEWFQRFRLLHRNPLPEVARRLRDADELIRGWLEREGSDNSVPSTVELAVARLRGTCEELRGLLKVAVQGAAELLAVPDTNALLRNPDTATYGDALGTDSYTVVLASSCGPC